MAAHMCEKRIIHDLPLDFTKGVDPVSTLHGLQCNGCGCRILVSRERGEGHPTKAVLEQVARKEGWHAPDRLGKHWCSNCRRPDGRRDR